MSKKITVIGTGYVGLIVAVGLADFGNTVTGVDRDKEKIDLLKKGVSPIYETGVEEYLKRNLDSGRLKFTDDISGSVKDSDVVYIAVGTPESEDGSPDLSFVFDAVKIISESISGYTVIVTKSTVPVGTNASIKKLLEQYAPGKEFDVVSNPEFLREGRAVEDFFHPDRTVIGYETERARETMFEVYRSLNVISVPFVWCSLETAELIKYASNAFLAAKITFINQMAELSEAVGADIHQVAKAMGMDGRISPYFLHPGPGYGGSCFPKDTKAVVDMGKKAGVDMSLIRAVIDGNVSHKHRVVETLEKMTGVLTNKTVTVLGLAFKQRTDDVRESPSITIIDDLIGKGCRVNAHDPKGIPNFRKLFPEIGYYENAYKAAEDSDAVIIATEWNEYRGLDLERLKSIVREPVILDTRNLLDPEKARRFGFVYRGVGRG